MTENPAPTDLSLVLIRLMDAPREAVFKAWSDPKLLAQWWAPLPYTTSDCILDLRSGGVFQSTMRAPDGQEFTHGGVFLEVVPNERIVFTDAFINAWTPSAKPFMTAIVTMEDVDGKTRYTARAQHWTEEDMETHKNMGFHDGWGLCASQLEALAKTL